MAKKFFSKKGGSFDRWIITAIIVLLVVIALLLWGPLRKFRSHGEKRPPAPHAAQQETAPPPKTPSPKAAKPRKQAAPAVKKELAKRETGPALLGGTTPEKTVQIAIVIDDLGQDIKQAQEIISLPAKITCAVLPGLPQSRKVAELAKQNKREVLLHLPMEPKNKSIKASPGTLRSDMTPMDFLNTISDDIASIPGAIGVNNHEGSALTENKEAMKFLMAELKARNLLFLDSLTSPKSVAYATAREFGLKTGKRDVFLDNESDNPGYIRKQLDELADTARQRGAAIGIGHPHPDTVNELRKWITETGHGDIEIVPVSRLIN
ncbi:MAG TPA: divergent polysaccharide deacetylase family protein [Nitrospirota bacterium]